MLVRKSPLFFVKDCRRISGCRRLKKKLSASKQFRSFLHAVCDLDLEGAPGLAALAPDAGGSGGGELCVVVAEALRHLALLYGKIIKLIHHGDIDVHGTGLAVSAIGALPEIRVQRGGSDDGSIILFVVRSCLVSDSLKHLILGVITAQDGCHCRPGQGIVDALNRG